MVELTRRSLLTGMTLGAANLLFSRSMSAGEVVGPGQGVPSVGNSHLLTLLAVNPNTLRLRVVQQGKQGPANETGIAERVWPEPFNESADSIPWGEYKIHLQQAPWQVSIVDGTNRMRQQIRLEPSTGAIHFSIGEGDRKSTRLNSSHLGIS